MESQDYIPALPPSSVDAERSVLGAVLQDSGAATLAFETLSPEDFYTAEHREIFSAMQTLHIAGNPIDLMTVGNELSRRGTLDSVGGPPICWKRCASCPPRPTPALTSKSCRKRPRCAS